jgi:hypothetical protein
MAPDHGDLECFFLKWPQITVIWSVFSEMAPDHRDPGCFFPKQPQILKIFMLSGVTDGNKIAE